MTIFRIAAVAALMVMGLQTAVADTWNKKTKVTFGQAVSVPGAVLPPGTYVFKLDESSANRHIVRIQNQRENKTFATVLAIPDYRLNASSKTVMYFGEKGRTDINGNPVAIKSWFYPGDNYGQRFVYPKKEATAIATVYNQPVATHTSTAVATPEAAPAASTTVVLTTPEKQETAYSAAAFDKADAQDTAGQDGEAVAATPAPAPAPAPVAEAPAPKKLPATNSPLPLFASLGGLLLAGSGLARFVSSRLR